MRSILIVLCVILLAWTVGESAVYAYRRDWVRLRRFLFAWQRGWFGAPNVLWAVLAVGTLIRIFA